MCQADDTAKGDEVSASPLQSSASAEAEYDYEGLPHPEIRRLVAKLERGVTGLDEEVWLALKGHRSTALPTEYLTCALSLIPEDWWWHMSHLEASIIPTSPVEGAENVLSNAGKYDKNGRPVSYRSMAHYDRGQLPCAVCAAMLKAHYDLPADFAVRESSLSEEPEEVIRARQERVVAFRDNRNRQIEERSDTATAEQTPEA